MKVTVREEGGGWSVSTGGLTVRADGAVHRGADVVAIVAVYRGQALLYRARVNLVSATSRRRFLKDLTSGREVQVGEDALLALGEAILRGSAPKPTGAAPLFEEVAPWHEPVAGPALVAELETFFRRYLVLPPRGELALAVWAIATWFVDEFDTAPYLGVLSPQRRCGKTRALELLSTVVYRPLHTTNVSEASLFRVVEEHRPTLLIDEARALLARSERGDILRALLTAGNRKGVPAVREERGPDGQFATRLFQVYGAKSFASTGELDDALADRCIIIRMKRRRRDETIERFRWMRVSREGNEVKRRIARWVQDNREAVRRAYMEIEPPETLDDRAAEVWAGLLAVIAVADPSRIPEVERVAVALSGGVDLERENIGVRLLADLRRIFTETGKDRLATGEIITGLCRDETGPWRDWHGKPITGRALADLLAPFGVRPEKWWDGETMRGYSYAALEDIFVRYLPPIVQKPPEPPEPSGDEGSDQFREPPEGGSSGVL